MTKKLLENNKVEITTVTQVDRYEGSEYYSQAEAAIKEHCAGEETHTYTVI